MCRSWHSYAAQPAAMAQVGRRAAPPPLAASPCLASCVCSLCARANTACNRDRCGGAREAGCWVQKPCCCPCIHLQCRVRAALMLVAAATTARRREAAAATLPYTSARVQRFTW